jgi:Zn-dependent peptidase ImmA (M78 family)
MRSSTRRKAESFSSIARKILAEVYARESERRGWKPSPEQFFPVPLQSVIEVLGWTLELVSGVGHTSTGWEPIHGNCDFDNKVVTVGLDNIPIARRNFTLAHEIGHIVLHSEHEFVIARRVASYRKPNFSPQDRVGWELEQDANLFAAELLMPRRAVRHRFESIFSYPQMNALSALRLTRPSESHTGEINAQIQIKASELLAGHHATPQTKSLHEFFGVSTTAMGKRLRELGHLTP